MTPLDPAAFQVVLVRSARAANVAAACRALKNMGLGAPRLVSPPPGLDGSDARALAYGAWDLLDAAPRCDRLEEAVAGSVLVVGTSGRTEPGDWTPRGLAEEGGARSAGGRVSVVFGPEASGLTIDELRLCHLRVHVPTDPGHPSLNLAQAVLIVAYEVRMAALGGRASSSPAKADDLAPVGEVEAALAELRAAGTAIGYLNPQQPEAILAEWRRLLARARPTRREVSLLRGLARQMGWAGRAVAKGSPRDG
jgi:TrmH family RNA methyltransferase